MNRIKKTYPSYYQYELDDIKTLCKEFASHGLTAQSWKVPTNNKLGVKDGVFTTEGYLSLHYNFAAVIGVFENPDNKDTVKILFVNISGSMKKFSDFTFPSSESEGPKYYIESSNEIRANGLSVYVKNLLKKLNRNKGLQYILASVLNVMSFIYVILYFTLYTFIRDSHPTFLPVASTLLIFAVIIIVFYFVSIKRGVYINNFPHPLLSFIDQMIKGSFIENPITFIFLRLLAVVITGIIGGFAFNVFQSILSW